MIQPQATVIGETTGADGYYEIITSNGVTASAVSILRATMTAGQTVTVIQCGDEYGIVALDKGLRGTLAVPSDARSTAESQGPASVALSSIGRWASLVQRVYVLGQVVSVGAASLVVDLLDGPFQGQRITVAVDTTLGIAVSDFLAYDAVVLRAWPDIIPTVVGWWDSKCLSGTAQWFYYPFLDKDKPIRLDGAEGSILGYSRSKESIPETEMPSIGFAFVGAISGGGPYACSVVGIGDVEGKTMRGFASGDNSGKMWWFISRSDFAADYQAVLDFWSPIRLIEFGPVPLSTPYVLPTSIGEIDYSADPAVPGFMLTTCRIGNWKESSAPLSELRYRSAGDTDQPTYTRYFGI